MNEKEEKVEEKVEETNDDGKKFKVKVDEKKSKSSKVKIIIGILILIAIVVAAVVGIKSYVDSKVNARKENGLIEYTIIDQSKFPIVGAEIQILKENGEEIGTVKSGADGKINFYNVPVGNYKMKIKSLPEGYERKESSETDLTIEDSTVTKLTIRCTRNVGMLKVIVENNNHYPMEDVEVNLYDHEGYLEQNKDTDEDGFVYFQIPEDGTYYFDLVADQEITGEYVIDTKMYKITVDDNNLTFIKEFELEKGLIENIVSEETKDTGLENTVYENTVS